jgi:hypothetical protein
MKHKNIDAYFNKLNQLITMMHGQQLQGHHVYDSQVREFLTKCKYKNKRNGLSRSALKALTMCNVLKHDAKTGYIIDISNVNDDNLRRAAFLMIEQSKIYNQPKTAVIKMPETVDIVQPQLFTESIVRENEKPIETNKDQQRQRIDALELQINKIITFFQSLKTTKQ